MATDWDAITNAMHAWVVACSGLSDQKVVWGQQDAPRPEAPAITLRISNISELGSVGLVYEPNPLVFADKVVTAIDVAANTFTIAVHGLVTADGPISVDSLGVLPGGLVDATDYWVIVVDANTLQLATSFARARAGLAVDLLSTGVGTVVFSSTPSSLRAGEELKAVSRGHVRASLELRAHSEPLIGNAMAVALLQRVRTRRELPSQQEILEVANVVCQGAERVRAIQGSRDDVLFEPRAYMDCYLTFTVDESEYITIIERVLGTNEILGEDFEVPMPDLV